MSSLDSRGLLAVVLALVLSSAGCVGTLPGGAAAGPETGQEWTVTVERVVDGDTLEVRFPDGHVEDVRLLGVDTPEVHVPNDPAEFPGVPDTAAGEAWLRDWGHRASEFARTELAGERVRIAVDPTADRRGSYGRLLVYVFADGETFNRQLLDRGYARVYPSAFSVREEYEAATERARRAGVGLWGYGQETTDSGDGGGLELAVVHADAAGDDRENLGDEYLVFENAGDRPIDLTGWTLRDGADHVYRFPEYVLDPGERVTVVTGSGADTDRRLYWGASAPVWNNGGDTVVVGDGDRVVLEERYGARRLPAVMGLSVSGPQ